jgi:type IV pilus assembly protein PilB
VKVKIMLKKIGEVLIDAGVISSEQLSNAIKSQKGSNRRIGRILVELGYSDEKQIAEALASQLFLPLVDCHKYNLTWEVLALVPKKIAEERVVLPLEVNGKKLLLAMADPLDMGTVDHLAFKTGMNISVAVSWESNILGVIDKYYGTEDIVWDRL